MATPISRDWRTKLRAAIKSTTSNCCPEPALLGDLCKGEPLATRTGLMAVIAAAVVGAAAALFLWIHLAARPQADWREAEAAAARRDLPAARAALERFLAAEPNSYPARLLMAQVARRAGFLQEARVQLDIAEAIEFRTAAVVREHVLIETQEGDLTNEAELWRLVKADDPAKLLILEGLARGYRKNYLLDDMQTALNRLLALQPDHVDALLDRAWVFERRFDLDNALKDCQNAVAIQPRDEEAQLRLAQLLLLMEKPVEAHDVLTPLHAQLPDDPRVSLALLQAYRKLGKTDAAEHLGSDLAAQYPKELSILLERGRFLMEQGDAAAAETVLRAAVDQAPFDYQANFSLQLCLRQLGRNKDADAQALRVQQLEDDLKQMGTLTNKLQKARNDPDVRSAIGKIFLRSGEEREGLAWLKTVLRLHPRHVPTHQALADYYERRRQPALAEHHRSFVEAQQNASPSPAKD